MKPLAPHADQAVRHAVDAYIDGRFLPTFEGDATFETRNSRYRLLDGVLVAAPDPALIGAELVGWLVEFVTRDVRQSLPRSEVTPTWKHGARAVLVDTRNDGFRGPHIIVTSATRHFRTARPGSAPRLAGPANPGSEWPQGGSSSDQSWDRYPVPVAPPAPVNPSWGAYAPAEPALSQVKTQPPPAMPRLDDGASGRASAPYAPNPRPAYGSYAAEAPLPPPPPAPSFGLPPMEIRPATPPPPPPPRPLPRALPPPFFAGQLESESAWPSVPLGDSDPRPAASRTQRAHQRGLPLR